MPIPHAFLGSELLTLKKLHLSYLPDEEDVLDLVEVMSNLKQLADLRMIFYARVEEDLAAFAPLTRYPSMPHFGSVLCQ